MKNGRFTPVLRPVGNARLRRRCAARKENYLEDLRLCRGSSSYKSPSTKRGTPASQAPQEFQTSIFFFLQLFYYHQLPKLGVLLYGFPQFRQKLQLRENGNSPSKKSLCSGTPALLRGGSFFRCGNRFLSFCRRHLRAQRARGVCGAHDTHIVEEEKVRARQYL